MQLGADHMHSTDRFDGCRNFDVGTAACHIGRYGHLARKTSSRDDLGLFGDLVGIQYFMFDACLVEQVRKHFALVNRTSTDQDRSSFVMVMNDFLHNGFELLKHGRKDLIGQSFTTWRTVSGDSQHRCR